jgi:MFS family permease
MNDRLGAPARTEEQASIAELVQRLSDQTSALARKEVELAKAELDLKAKRLGVGAGAFGVAGLLGLFAFGALVAAAILALAEAMDGWLAALIVAVVIGAVAGLLALAGKRKVEAGTPPTPERAVESTKRDVAEIKASAMEGRRG